MVVEIFIPVYNGERFLAEAIASALAQTHTDVRVIVVDNASTDQTVAVAESFLHDPRLSIVREVRNTGMTNNFTACVDRRGAAYFTILCADNVLRPYYVARMLEVFAAHPGCDVVTGCTETLQMPAGMVIGNSVRTGVPIHVIPPRQIIEESYICFNAFMVRPGFAFRFDPAFTYSPDEKLWREWAMSGATVTYVPEVLATYRVHESNMGRVTGFLTRLHEQLAAIEWIERQTAHPEIARWCLNGKVHVCEYLWQITTDQYERHHLARLVAAYVSARQLAEQHQTSGGIFRGVRPFLPQRPA